MDYSLFLYFFAGVAQNFIFSLYVRSVAVKRIYLASICAFFQTLIILFVTYDIIANLKNPVSIILYALGIAVGTFLAVKIKKT